MMNNCLLLKAEQNGFFTEATFKIFGNIYLARKVKIDTGCSYTTIPYRRLIQHPESALQMKVHDIDDNIEYLITYGVESGGLKHKKPITREEKIDCAAMKFKHPVDHFFLNGYEFTDREVYVNYDRRGNILIGMDILQLMDFHCGESLADYEDEHIQIYKGDFLFLGCLKSQITLEYLNALDFFFGYDKTERIITKLLGN